MVIKSPKLESVDGEELQDIAEAYEHFELAIDHEYEVNEDEGFIDMYGGSKPIGPRVLVGLLQSHGVMIAQVMHHSQIHSLENDSFGYRLWFAEAKDELLRVGLDNE